MSIEPVFQEPSNTDGPVDEGAHRKSKKPRPVKHQGIEPRQFVRKPFYVTGVQVTEENIHEVAEWCGGLVRENGEGKPFIKVHTTKAMYDRQTRAIPGDWVLKAGNSWKVYTNKAFKEVFEEETKRNDESVVEHKPVDSNPTSTLSPEARAALLAIAKNITEVAS